MYLNVMTFTIYLTETRHPSHVYKHVKIQPKDLAKKEKQ